MKLPDNIYEWAQYEDIPYQRDFCCPGCGIDLAFKEEKRKIVGYCNTSLGYMMIFECADCYEKLRFHCCTTERWDKEKFFYMVLMSLFLRNQITSEEFLYYQDAE